MNLKPPAMFSSDHIVCFMLAAVLHLLGLLLAGQHLARPPADDTVPELEVASVELTLEGAAPDTAASAASGGARRPDALSSNTEAVPPRPVPAEPPPLPPPAQLPEPSLALPAAQPLTGPTPAPIRELSDWSDVSEPSDQSDPSDTPAPSGPVATLESGGGASGQINAHPSLERAIRPTYPIASRRRGEEGTVILDVSVGVDGRAAAVSLVSSSGFPDLDRAAVRAAEQARFKPGTRNGKPVASAARLTLIFRLRDA